MPRVNQDFIRFFSGFSVVSMPNLDVNNQYGYLLGLSYAHNITKGKHPFFLQGGCEFICDWRNTRTQDEFVKEWNSGVAFPVNLVYREELSETIYADVFFGPNFRLNCSAGMESSSSSVKRLRSADYLQGGLVNRFQFGLNMGASIDISRWVLSYRFNPDLTDYFDAEKLKQNSSDDESEVQSKTHYHLITLGYTF